MVTAENIANQFYDAVVIGGGPAGLFLGHGLASRGHKTLVIEKGVLPRDKVCGEGIMPAGVASLKRQGFLDFFESDFRGQYASFKGLTFLNENLSSCSVGFAPSSGIGLPRALLSRILSQKIAGLNCLKVLSQTHFVGFEENKNEVTVEYRVGEVFTKIRTRFLFGADGQRSLVAKTAGLSRRSSSSKPRIGIRKYFQVHHWSEHVEIWFSRIGEAYVTPIGVDQVQLMLLTDQSQTKKFPGPLLFTELMKSFPSLHQKLREGGAISLSEPRAYGPFGSYLLCGGTRRTFLIGDALGFTDGITGSGMAMAFAQGETIIEEFSNLLLAGEMLSEKSKQLQSQLVKIVKRDRLLANAMLSLQKWPLLRCFAIKLLKYFPRVLAWMISQIDKNYFPRTPLHRSQIKQ